MDQASLDFPVAQFQDTFLKTAIGLAAILVLVNFIWSVGRTMVLTNETSVDYAPFIRSLIMLIALMLFPGMFEIVDTGLDFVAGLVVPQDSSEVLESLEKNASTVLSGYEKSIKDYTWKGFNFDSIKENFMILMENTASAAEYLIFMLCNIIAQGLAIIVRVFMGKVQVITYAFVRAVGPLAILFSMIPGFSATFNYWLKNLFQVKCWMLTIGILDQLVIMFTDNMLDGVVNAMNGGSFEGHITSVINVVIVNLVFISCYLGVPLLTSMYIGGAASAAAFGSKTQRMARL